MSNIKSEFLYWKKQLQKQRLWLKSWSFQSSMTGRFVGGRHIVFSCHIFVYKTKWSRRMKNGTQLKDNIQIETLLGAKKTVAKILQNELCDSQSVPRKACCKNGTGMLIYSVISKSFQKIHATGRLVAVCILFAKISGQLEKGRVFLAKCLIRFAS